MSLDAQAPDLRFGGWFFEIISPVKKTWKMDVLYYGRDSGIDAIVRIDSIEKLSNFITTNHCLSIFHITRCCQEGTTEKSGEEIARFFDFMRLNWIHFLLFQERVLGLYSDQKTCFKVLAYFLFFWLTKLLSRGSTRKTSPAQHWNQAF